MNERLIIRLASKATQKNHWLIWSDSEDEIIASGELDNAEQLNLLTEKAQQRSVVCLLPGVDVAIREVAINGSFNRQMQQALPYLVEDELASDVDLLHFCVIAKQTDLVHVAICEKSKIAMWLSWLADAQISCRQFIPEGLALPIGEAGHWQAVQLDQQWLIRETENIAWSCEAEMLDLLITSKSSDGDRVYIDSYSPSAANQVGEWQNLLPVLPMELLARGVANNKVNLLSGEFKANKEKNLLLEKWRLPAILAAILLVVVMANQYRQNINIEQQTAQVRQRVEAVYQQAFPMQSRLPYARIKKRMKSMLVGLEGTVDSGFLSMLNDLLPAFASNPQFNIDSIKFEQKKQELRIAANADNFQSFEKFTTAIADKYDVQQGALSSNKDKVSGLLTIRIK